MMARADVLCWSSLLFIGLLFFNNVNAQLTFPFSKTVTFSRNLAETSNIYVSAGLPGDVRFVVAPAGESIEAKIEIGAQTELDANQVVINKIEEPSSFTLIFIPERTLPTQPPTETPSEEGNAGSSASLSTLSVLGLASWSVLSGVYGLFPFVAAQSGSPPPVFLNLTISIPRNLPDGKIPALGFTVDTRGKVYLPKHSFQNSESRSSCSFSIPATADLNYAPPRPQGEVKCPYCCGGKGICHIECICDEGFQGPDCLTPVPSEIIGTTGFPATSVASKVFEKEERFYALFRSSTSNTLYFRNKTETTWRLLSSNVREVIQSETQKNIIITDGNNIYLLNETSNRLLRIDNIQNGPGLIDGFVLTPTLVAVVKDTTNPGVFTFDPDSLSWTNTGFPFTNLDGKPHVRLLIDFGKTTDVYYESNYSGTFRLRNGVWTKVQNEIAPVIFNLANSGNKMITNVQLETAKAKVEKTRWSNSGRGLPIWYKSKGIVSLNGFLFMSVYDSILNGVYQFNGVTWLHRAFPPSQYGTGKIIQVGGHIYVQGHNSLWRLILAESDPVNNRTTWVHTGQFLQTRDNGYEIFAGKNSIYFFSDSTNPQIFELQIEPSDVNVGKLYNLSFPFRNLDGKPHIDIKEDNDGNVWYVSNYNGTFKYDRQAQSWSKSNSRSGQLSIASDGSIFLSYEITPTTQISTFFKYSQVGGEHVWKQAHIDRGYGIGCYPIEDGALACIGNRFSEFVIKGTKKWKLREIEGDLSLTVDEQLSQGCDSVATLGNVIFCDHQFQIKGKKLRRVISIEADLSKPSYDSNLEINSGTYLCQGESISRDVKILPNGNIMAAFDCMSSSIGKTNYLPLFGSPTPADKGRIVILNPQASGVIYARSLNATILDTDVAGESIIIATNEGIYKIDPDTWLVDWEFAYQSEKKRVSFSSNHVAALLDNNLIALFDQETGKQLWNKTLVRSYTEDVAVDSQKDTFIAVGFDNKKLPSGLPVQVAFLNAFSLSGNQKYSLFSFDGKDLSSNIADTRLYQANVGKDGKLYLLGESAGSETIFRYDGKRFSGNSTLRSIDFYNDLWNTKSAHISYQARVNLETGVMEGSQLTMARLPSGLSNAFRVGDIAGDENGNVYVAGTSTAFYANRDATSINGILVGQYNGDPAYLSIQSDFNNRKTWVSFIRDKTPLEEKKNKGGSMEQIDVRGNVVVVMADIKQGGEAPITPNNLIGSNDLTDPTHSQVYISVFNV